MAKDNANINGEVLKWARTSSNLSLEAAAASAQISPSKGVSAAERLAGWEAGIELPSKNQLHNLAKTYRKPVLAFYRKSPPKESANLVDFRNFSQSQEPLATSALDLEALISRIKAQQIQLKEILLDDEDENIPSISFIEQFTVQDTPKFVASRMREVLNISLNNQMQTKNSDEFFKLLRRKIEESGVFVILKGDLGSHHSAIPAELYRGLAISDKIAPLIAINPNDAKSARVFTLLHEYAHLWLGQGGISNFGLSSKKSSDAAVEYWCDSVASEFLMPEADFLGRWNSLTDSLNVFQKIEAISKVFSVSRAATANRLWKTKAIPEDTWWSIYRHYQKEWKQNKQKQKEGGPSHYVVAKHNLGEKTISTVFNAVNTGEITYNKAARILGIKSKGFSKLQAES